MAMGLCLSSMVPVHTAHAANTDGAVIGRSEPGAQLTINNPATGFTRTVTADEQGNYRFPFLPVGTYSLQASRDGAQIGRAILVNVSLGTTTTANATGATTLAAVEVVANIVTPVDVTSTESATNITAAEMQRLPVERDALAVALLAPGLVKGEFGGVSFGGSSVAENTVYINGLNVTDFYNRVGFSSVPFAFYQEFQVKTGGYSVEFGRTTGGVINAVTKSGTNEFHYGAEAVWEPSWLQTAGTDRYDDGNPYYISSHDEFERKDLNLWASGPIVKDKLFFFAMYELRDYKPVNTDSTGSTLTEGNSDDGFWGAKLDWQITDNHLLELLAFSDKNENINNIYNFDLASGSRRDFENKQFVNNGGDNWALTYTGYLTDNFSMKAMYGKNERQYSQFSQNDIDCSRIRDRREVGDGDIGCTSNGSVIERLDEREAARLDFEWSLGDHLLRFGLDREANVSNHQQYYPGPDRLVYEINDTEPGATLENGGIVPAGVTGYVRTRTNEVDGQFETVNDAIYIEDNWTVNQHLVLNFGLRREGFDNKNSDGESYIKIDDMLAPRFGFSWDPKGEGRTKVFGNIGRYFLPVANVINIKQAGGFSDERTFYVFEGLEDFTYNGVTYQRPILGAQIGPVDNSQGDGTVGDLRGEVDRDMDPVYQDELILGFQSMIDETWSWGVRSTYRKLSNAIDDMEISATSACGSDGYIGWVMANPGEEVTVWGDTNCDDDADGWVTVDTSREGWAQYRQDGVDADGDAIMTYIGQRGWEKPRRSYTALEFQLDRAWDDKWAMNASYTLAYSKGNAEGPVNTDTDFSDTGRTENFDDPWVNLNATGYLPNDRRHQIKLRGTYAITDNWQVGATLATQSGRPFNAFGVGNPFDATNYHSMYVCVANCTSDFSAERVYELHHRASSGRLAWTYDLGASITYLRSFGSAKLRAKLAMYNLLNEERVQRVQDQLDSDIGFRNPTYGRGFAFQSPRYGQLTVSLDF